MQTEFLWFFRASPSSMFLSWTLVTLKDIHKKAYDTGWGFSNIPKFTQTRGRERKHFIVLFGGDLTIVVKILVSSMIILNCCLFEDT